MHHKLSRRVFLRISALIPAAAILAGCNPAQLAPEPTARKKPLPTNTATVEASPSPTPTEIPYGLPGEESIIEGLYYIKDAESAIRATDFNPVNVAMGCELIGEELPLVEFVSESGRLVGTAIKEAYLDELFAMVPSKDGLKTGQWGDRTIIQMGEFSYKDDLGNVLISMTSGSLGFTVVCKDAKGDIKVGVVGENSALVQPLYPAFDNGGIIASRYWDDGDPRKVIDVRLESSGDKLTGRLQVMSKDGSVKALKFIGDKESAEVKSEFLIIENKLHQYDEATGKYVPMRYPDNEEVEADEFLYDEKGRLLVLEHTRQIARMVIFPNSDAVLVAGNRFVYNEMRYTWNNKSKQLEEVKITMTKEEVLAKAEEFLSGGYKNYLNPVGPMYFRDSNGRMLGGINYNFLLGIWPGEDWLERDWGKMRTLNTTPVFIGLWRDDEQNMLFGALDRNKRPFVWLLQSGLKKPNSKKLKWVVGYEYDAGRGKYAEWGFNNPILTNPDDLASALMQEQGKPVFVYFLSLKSIYPDTYADEDRKALQILFARNYYEIVETLLNAYRGSGECKFAFRNIDELEQFDGLGIPQIHAVDVWKGDN